MQDKWNFEADRCNYYPRPSIFWSHGLHHRYGSGASVSKGHRQIEVKIKIGIPKADPQVSIEVDTKVVVQAFKEALERLPFKVQFKGKKGRE